MHIAAAESGVTKPFRVNFSLEDKTRFEYWNRIRVHAKNNGTESKQNAMQ